MRPPFAAFYHEWSIAAISVRKGSGRHSQQHSTPPKDLHQSLINQPLQPDLLSWGCDPPSVPHPSLEFSNQNVEFLISLKLFLVPFNEVAVRLSMRCVCSWRFNRYLSLLVSNPTSDPPPIQVYSIYSQISPLMLALHNILLQNLRHARRMLQSLRSFHAAGFEMAVSIEEVSCVGAGGGEGCLIL